MWICPFCGGHNGMPYQDQQLRGILCLHPECGRFHTFTEKEGFEIEGFHYESDF